MSDFVNYNKRSVTLPKGCKDLVDLVEHERKVASRQLSDVKRTPGLVQGGETQQKLEDLERYAARAFESDAPTLALQICSHDERLAVVFWRDAGGQGALVAFKQDSGWDEELRVLFERHGLQAPEKFDSPKFSAPSFAEAERVICELRPVPPNAARFCEIARDIFQAVCGLGEESPIRFRHVEIGCT